MLALPLALSLVIAMIARVTRRSMFRKSPTASNHKPIEYDLNHVSAPHR